MVDRVVGKAVQPTSSIRLVGPSQTNPVALAFPPGAKTVVTGWIAAVTPDLTSFSEV